MRRIALAAAALALCWPLAGPAAAQLDGPARPRPRLCAAEPMSLDALLAVGTPAPATPAADDPFAGLESLDIADVPAGTPADAETAQAIADLELAYASCYNAGELLRAATMLSPRALPIFSALAQDPAFDDYFASPTPFDPSLRIPSVEVQDVRVLDDGRAAAVVLWGPEANFHVYAPDGAGGWLLDEEISLTGDVPTSAATPAASPAAEG